MKHHITIFTLNTVLLFTIGCSKNADRPETLTEDYNEKEMTKAIDTARSRVDEFIAVLKKRDADSFSVKAPVTDPNGTEHFWISDVSYAEGQFSGMIGNDPGIVRNVRFGQTWKVAKDEITDWMFTRGERIHGGFTIDPLLSTMPEEQANALREKLVR